MNNPSKMWQITELFEKIRWQSVGAGQYLMTTEQPDTLEALIEEVYEDLEK
jgi:hypothetical protein